MTPVEVIADHKIELKAIFVPFSRSRNAKSDHKSLNWRVTILRGGAVVLETDYMAGSGHCPANTSRQVKNAWSLKWAAKMRNAMIDYEVEHGVPASYHEGTGKADSRYGGKPIKPKVEDVLYSVVSDSEVLDYASYEEFADAFGYEVDSRSGEAIYRACLEHALKMRSAFGEAGMAALREAFQDY